MHEALLGLSGQLAKHRNILNRGWLKVRGGRVTRHSVRSASSGRISPEPPVAINLPSVAAPAQRCIKFSAPFLRLLVGLVDLEIGRGGVVEDQPAQQIVLEESIETVRLGEQRRDRVDAYLRVQIPSWSLFPLVQNLCALRGLDMIASAGLAATIGDPSASRQRPTSWAISAGST